MKEKNLTMDFSTKPFMKRVVFYQYGSAEVLKIQQSAIPKPKGCQVLVRNSATSINSGDLLLRQKKIFSVFLSKFS